MKIIFKEKEKEIISASIEGGMMKHIRAKKMKKKFKKIKRIIKKKIKKKFKGREIGKNRKKGK